MLNFAYLKHPVIAGICFLNFKECISFTWLTSSRHKCDAYFFFLIDFIVAVLMGRFSLISQLFLLGFGFFNFLVGWFWVFLGWWAVVP